MRIPIVVKVWWHCLWKTLELPFIKWTGPNDVHQMCSLKLNGPKDWFCSCGLYTEEITDPVNVETVLHMKRTKNCPRTVRRKLVRIHPERGDGGRAAG